MNINDMQYPVDSLQAQCLSLRAWLNQQFADAKREAAKWVPRACPPRR